MNTILINLISKLISPCKSCYVVSQLVAELTPNSQEIIGERCSIERKAKWHIGKYHEMNINGFNDYKIHQPPQTT